MTGRTMQVDVDWSDGQIEGLMLAFVRQCFGQTRCRYTLQVAHKVAENETMSTKKKPITVNMLSNSSATFPCSVHELVYVLPNATFLPPGSTFGGVEEKPKLSGKRAAQTGILAADALNLLSMPPHDYSVTDTGKFSLTCTTTRAQNAEKIEFSADETRLFSCEVVKLFMGELLSRMQWLHTERTGCIRPLRLEGKTLLNASGVKPVTVQVLSTADGESMDRVVPINVEFLQLSFADVREEARAIWAALPENRRRMYSKPAIESDFKSDALKDALGWGDARIRRVVDRRLDDWNREALDRTETPWLRNAPGQKNRRNTQKPVNEADTFKPGDMAQSTAINKRLREDRIQQIQDIKNASKKGYDVDPQYKNVTKHVFFHTANELRDAPWTSKLDWLLLKTTIVYRNQPNDRVLETAERKADDVKTNLGKNKMSFALASLNIALKLIPVYQPTAADDQTFAFDTREFRRLLYLLNDASVRKALGDAYKSDVNPTPAARELFIRMRQFGEYLSVRGFKDEPENKAIGYVVAKLASKGVFQDIEYDGVAVDGTAKIAESDGLIDIVVRTSRDGDISLNEPTMIAPRRSDFIEAVNNAIMRLFYEPHTDNIRAFFTPTVDDDARNR